MNEVQVRLLGVRLSGLEFALDPDEFGAGPSTNSSKQCTLVKRIYFLRQYI
jgi:hypothetical protein